MSALIHALYETKNVGVARFVARKNAAPRLVALLPQIKASHEVITAGDDVMVVVDMETQCLLMLHLPFMEDVRQYTFPSLAGASSGPSTPSGTEGFQPLAPHQFTLHHIHLFPFCLAEQLAAVDSLISSMDLMSANR